MHHFIISIREDISTKNGRKYILKKYILKYILKKYSINEYYILNLY